MVIAHSGHCPAQAIQAQQSCGRLAFATFLPLIFTRSKTEVGQNPTQKLHPLHLASSISILTIDLAPWVKSFNGLGKGK